jgi:hypothetical protein
VKVATPLDVAHVEVGQPQPTVHDRDATAPRIGFRLSSDQVTGGWQVREMKPVQADRP